jgi:hypothetical protein
MEGEEDGSLLLKLLESLPLEAARSGEPIMGFSDLSLPDWADRFLELGRLLLGYLIDDGVVLPVTSPGEPPCILE